MHLGLGTAAIGRPHYINVRNEITVEDFDLESFKNQGLRLLNDAYEMGIRYFDTAPGYGMAEELLIYWLSNIKGEEIDIATKWGYTYVADFNANATEHEIKEHSLDKLNQQWEQSKKLLPFLSTYQIHSATFESGVLNNIPVLNRLAELKADHGIKIGITTSGSNQLEVLKKALEVEVDALPIFEVFQVTYNILDQHIASIFNDSMVQDRRFVIKEALANGRIFPNNNFEHYRPLYDYLEALAEKYGVNIDAVALRFCEESIHPFMILSGASETDHLIGNVLSLEFELTDEEIARLRHFVISPDSYWEERSSMPWN